MKRTPLVSTGARLVDLKIERHIARGDFTRFGGFWGRFRGNRGYFRLVKVFEEKSERV